MEKREEHRKKEWQKPEYKSLKFSETLGGLLQYTAECTGTTGVCS